MKKYYFLIIVALILGLVLTGCSLLSNISQVPATEQSGITYLTKNPSSLGLVGLWHFDDDALDGSGNGNTGTLVNGPQWVSGKFGNALSFNGSDDYVDLGNDVFSNVDLATYTFEAWIKIASLDEVERRIFDDEGGLRPALSSTNTLQAVHYDGTVKIVEWATTPSVDTWYHVVQRYDGSYLRLYINGSEVGTPVLCGAWTPDSLDRAVRIGASWHPTPGRHWKGLIDEVRIWDGAMTFDQIQESFALGAPHPDATVVELGEKFFGDEVVIFTSSFYGLDAECVDYDTVDVYMMSNYGETISGVSPRNKLYTPNKTSGCIELEGTTHEGTSTSIEVGRNDCKSIHLSLDLTSGRSVGFNAQFLPYD